MGANMNSNTLNNCLLCGDKSDKKVTEYKASIWAKNKMFSKALIHSCQNCGVGYIKNPPDRTELNNFYEKEYRSEESPFYINFNVKNPPFARDHRSIAQLMLGLQYTEFSNKDVFIDLGPGIGSSFNELKEIVDDSIDLKLCAVEHSEGAANYYKRLYDVDTFKDTSECISSLKRKPKFLLSSHCLEHFRLDDAINFLTELKNSFENGGICVFEVPNVDISIHETIRGADDPHLIFFSKESLRIIFENSGYEVLFLETCGQMHAKQIVTITSTNILNQLKNTILKNIRKLLSNSPFKKILISYFSKITFKDENFKYGGNRQCLRIVARPK